MKLENFIKKLEKIAENHGKNSEVIMADDIPVVNPIFSDKYPRGNKVVITDEK